MDPRLLDYYNLELQHLREMGAEFAAEFPKTAARLGMNGVEVTDPYVERLIEGVGFLAARVHLKLDAEFPRFTQALLESVYPHYLAPTPSMVVAQFTPDYNEPALARGFTVPRESTMHGVKGADDLTACEFRTAHPVTLWPVEVESVRYFSHAPDLRLNEAAAALGKPINGGVRIRLKCTAALKFSQTSIDRLTFFLAGQNDTANRLYELCLSAGVGALVAFGRDVPRESTLLRADAIRPVGFSDDEALLPSTLRSFHGYRLLQEYFSFPQRFRFVELAGLAGAIKGVDANELELVILFERGDRTLEPMVDTSNFALYCTPAINLFSKRADRIHLTESAHEYHVVADRTRPIDFEVYAVTEVLGHGIGSESERQFLPFYTAYATDEAGQRSAYFTLRRQPRRLSEEERRRGGRSSYIGSEVFLSLVDSAQAPFSGDLRQLSIQTLCTNRDLVLQMPVGIVKNPDGTPKSDFSLDVNAPQKHIRVVSGPSRPYAALADGAIAWRAISHLSLNYLSLADSSSGGAVALRDLLELYAQALAEKEIAQRQINGIQSVRVRRVVDRLPPPPRVGMSGEREAQRLAFGRGLEIGVVVEEKAFEGGSAFLLGAVLHHFFARYVSMNSFTKTRLRSLERGDIGRWEPQWGARPTL